MLLFSCDIHMQKNANTCYMHMQEIANTCMSNNFQLLCVSSSRGVPYNNTHFLFGPYSSKGGNAWYHNTPPKFRTYSPLLVPVW